MKNIAVVTINQPSLDAAFKLQNYLSGYNVCIYSKKNLTYKKDNLKIYEKLDDILDEIWNKFEAIIFILALGAVVRKIAPLLKDKITDPAVLIINIDLNRVIPLLSGHLGGANELASFLSKSIPECINFITTATDQTNTLAFDLFAKKEQMQIKNISYLATVSNALINKQEVKVYTYKSIYEKIKMHKNIKLVDRCEDELCVNITPFPSSTLHLIPPLYLGIGCNRGVSKESIKEAVKEFLKKYQLTFSQIKSLGTFEAKRDETGLIEFAKESNLKIEFFSKEHINSLHESFSPSFAKKFFGIKGVAEPSALLASKYKELIIKKEVFNKEITVAGAI